MAMKVELDAIGPDGWAPPDDVLAMVAELRAAREVVRAAPTVEHLRDLIGWLDLIDKFASMVEPTYDLPRDEIQRDIGRLADALERYQQRVGAG